MWVGYMHGDKLKIVQINNVLLYGDAVTNVMRANDEIFKKQNWQSDLVVNLLQRAGK